MSNSNVFIHENAPEFVFRVSFQYTDAVLLVCDFLYQDRLLFGTGISICNWSFMREIHRWPTLFQRYSIPTPGWLCRFSGSWLIESGVYLQNGKKKIRFKTPQAVWLWIYRPQGKMPIISQYVTTTFHLFRTYDDAFEELSFAMMTWDSGKFSVQHYSSPRRKLHFL